MHLSVICVLSASLSYHNVRIPYRSILLISSTEEGQRWMRQKEEMQSPPHVIRTITRLRNVESTTFRKSETTSDYLLLHESHINADVGIPNMRHRYRFDACTHGVHRWISQPLANGFSLELATGYAFILYVHTYVCYTRVCIYSISYWNIEVLWFSIVQISFLKLFRNWKET